MSTHRVAAVCAALFLAALLLACASTAGVPAAMGPRWACPSPTPLPFGPAGPVKARNPLPTAEPSGPQEYEEVYYQEWEQEYSALGGPPFPSPTPYSVQGTNFVLGQRVRIDPLMVLVQAHDGPPVEGVGIAPGTQQLYQIDITWINRSSAAIPLNLDDIRLRAVTTPDGRIVTDAWTVSDTARDVAGVTDLADHIPPGESRLHVPILAPRGHVKTVEIRFAGQPGFGATPTPTSTSALTPTPTPTVPADLRDPAPVQLVVQWTDTTLAVGPGCSDPGALTDWGGGDWGNAAPIAVAAPPGAARVVQIALNQIGKRYVWGSKGPKTFDCSGLMTWSYAQIGIGIPSGTAGQWPRMASVDASQLQPGDLIFFAVETPGQIDHVGMLIGDLDGDGTWDMVHASAPCCGVRIENDVLHRPFWHNKIAGFRTARGGG